MSSLVLLWRGKVSGLPGRMYENGMSLEEEEEDVNAMLG